MSPQHDHDVPTPREAAAPGVPGGGSDVRGPKVVVGFDNSQHATRALNTAAYEADRRGAALEILCGWPWEPAMSPAAADDLNALDRARRHLEEAADRVRSVLPQVPVTPSLTADSAVDALLRLGGQAALTVVGTRGHGGFVGLLLGSVSLRLAAHSTSPLLVVGQDDGTGPGQRRGRVLVGMKSDGDLEALAFGFAEAERRGATLTVLHTWQFSPYPDDIHHTTAATTLISTAVQQLREKFPAVDASVESLQERAAKALVEESAWADVVVIAAHRRKHRLGPRVGPVVHALLSHARCPVALVPVGS